MLWSIGWQFGIKSPVTLVQQRYVHRLLRSNRARLMRHRVNETMQLDEVFTRQKAKLEEYLRSLLPRNRPDELVQIVASERSGLAMFLKHPLKPVHVCAVHRDVSVRVDAVHLYVHTRRWAVT